MHDQYYTTNFEEMIKIGLIIDNITNKAGTERAVSNLVNGLMKFYSDYSITIISLFSESDEQSFFELNENISVIHLNKVNNFNFLNKIFWYKQLVSDLKKINSQYNFNVILGTTYVHNILLPFVVKNTKTRTIGCEHEVYGYPSGIIRKIRKKIYPKLDRIVVLNHTEQSKFGFLTNTTIIPNSLPFETEKKAELINKKIIAVGRLTDQKGFDMLIDVFDMVRSKMPDWELNIFGEGEDFSALESKIKSKKAEHCINLRGSVKNISKKYFESSIFALSSRWESFGLVVIEAMSYGLPVVAFDCDGPKNIIADGENGFLIPKFDLRLFSEKLLCLMQSSELRSKLGSQASESSVEYQEKNIIPIWNKLIQSIVNTDR